MGTPECKGGQQAQKADPGQSKILLVEDNPADADLLNYSLTEKGYAGIFEWVTDGADALEYIFRRGKYAHALRPCLVLLDLNLPKIDGREVLRQMKANQKTRSIPVIVLTTSKREDDVLRSHEYGVSSFITKPSNLHDFEVLVQRLIFVEFPGLGIKAERNERI